MTSLHPSLRLALISKAKKQKNILQKGFTLVELMVVVAIVGILSAVALPALTEAQEVAKASAAKQEAVNGAKSCTIALLKGDSTLGDVGASAADDDVTNSAITCAKTVDYVFTGGGVQWTVAVKDGVAGEPEDTTPTTPTKP